MLADMCDVAQYTTGSLMVIVIQHLEFTCYVWV